MAKKAGLPYNKGNPAVLNYPQLTVFQQARDSLYL